MTVTAQQPGSLSTKYTDRRRSTKYNRRDSTLVTGGDAFVANAGGSTTTIVGANAAPGTNDNQIVRRGEKFMLFTSAGVLKEDKVFRATNIAVGASTTVTFTPAAAAATVSGDRLRRVGAHPSDLDSMTQRLLALGYTAGRISNMTVNDMIYAIRLADNPGSI